MLATSSRSRLARASIQAQAVLPSPFGSLLTLPAKLLRFVSSASVDAGVPSVVLYQYAICPFCHQAKTLLDYSNTDYQPIEVNPLTKQEIKWSKDYRKVPIATIDETPVFGSDKIVNGLLENDAVRKRLEMKWGNNLTMNDFASSDSAVEWIAFAKDELAPLLYPNMCRTLSDAYAAFDYVNHQSSFSPIQRIAIRSIGSLAMYLAASRVKKRLNIDDEKKTLDEALTKFESKGLDGSTEQAFLSGKEEPDLGDLAVYGTLRSIEGLPAHSQAVYGRRLKDGSPGILPLWYERVKAKVEREQDT